MRDEIVYKRLPNNSLSSLSLNEITVTLPPGALSRFNGMTGNMLYQWGDAPSEEIACRLAALLLTLRRKDIESDRMCSKLTDEDQHFWQSCQTVYFLSAKFSSNEGNIIQAEVNNILRTENAVDLSVKVISSPFTHSFLGCVKRFEKFVRAGLVFHLEKDIHEHTGQDIHCILMNDAETAALPYAGKQAAIITLGTNLGIGYPPASAEGLRAVGEIFCERI